MAFSGQAAAVAAIVYVCLLAVIYARRGRWPLYRILAGRKACIYSISILLFLLLIFGLVPQDGGGNGFFGALGFRAMKRSPVFLLAILFLSTGVTLSAIDDIRHFPRHHLGATCAHLGLAVILITGLFGGGTTERAKIEAAMGTPVHTASDERTGAARKLPFELTLKSFDAESYTSGVAVALPDGSFYETSVSVNHPAKIGSWRLYQTDYRMNAGTGEFTSVLKCVYCPLSGIYKVVLYLILFSAAVMAFFCGARKPGERRRFLASIAVSVIFICICIFRPGVHTQDLIPALRSPWLVPHVAAYIFAYTLMGVVTVLAIRILILTRGKKAEAAPSQPSGDPVSGAAAPRRPIRTELRLCDTLVRIGWAFLTMGMAMGALWAKQAWGDYWTWDPKETWAAVTWLSYLLYLHLRRRGTGLDGAAVRSMRAPLYLLIFSFLLLQMCWWGVNLLPAARALSLHTY